MRDQLLEILKRFPERRIVVAGDLIADEFIYGRTSRISREAPVLVLEYERRMRLPGGAANAANNLLDLGCRVTVLGAVGRDEEGRDLLAILKRKGADIRGVRRIGSYATPVKTRILAGAHHSTSQQIVRLDREPRPGSTPPIPWSLIQRSLARADGLILSDYGYGAFSNPPPDGLMRTARERRVPVVVDSRFDMAAYPGVTAVTPNITELESSMRVSIGSDARRLNEAGRQVLRRQRLDSLLVTQGRFGMTLFERRKAPLHIPVYGTDEVADVTGAGDTVIAVFTLALSCGATPECAARLANYAGGIVVMKRGTATVTSDELRAAVEKDSAEHSRV